MIFRKVHSLRKTKNSSKELKNLYLAFFAVIAFFRFGKIDDYESPSGENNNIFFFFDVKLELFFCFVEIVNVCRLSQSECPDTELKSSPKFSKKCPKSNHSSLTGGGLLFTLAQKFTMHLGYFW